MVQIVGPSVWLHHQPPGNIAQHFFQAVLWPSHPICVGEVECSVFAHVLENVPLGGIS